MLDVIRKKRSYYVVAAYGANRKTCRKLRIILISNNHVTWGRMNVTFVRRAEGRHAKCRSIYGCNPAITRLRVFENMVLRRIFGHRRDEVTGEWRRLHNEELNDLYCSPNIVRVIKWRRMRWAGHVARMGEERVCIGSWWGNRRERDHWGDLGVDG